MPPAVSCQMWATKHSAVVYGACQHEDQDCELNNRSDKDEVLYGVLTSSKVLPEGFSSQASPPAGALTNGSRFMQLPYSPPITVRPRASSQRKLQQRLFQVQAPQLRRSPRNGSEQRGHVSRRGLEAEAEAEAEATSPQTCLLDTPVTRSTTGLDIASCYMILVDRDTVYAPGRSVDHTMTS